MCYNSRTATARKNLQKNSREPQGGPQNPPFQGKMEEWPCSEDKRESSLGKGGDGRGVIGGVGPSKVL